MKAVFAYKTYKTFRTEIRVVLVTLAVLLLLPILAVAIVANAGVQAVSDVLAAVNPITHKVEVKNADGKVIAVLDATTAWPVCGYISEEFGVPHMPWQPYHTGIDIANPWSRIGDPVTPFMAGTVTAVIDSGKGLGKHVIVDHGNGITSSYGHLSGLNAVEGQNVKPGDVIGYEGSTGASTGPHVHFETRVAGIPVNPHIFMVGTPPGC